MRYFVSLLLAFAVVVQGGAIAAATTEPDRPDTAEIDSYVESYLDRHGLVGAGIAVVHDGEVVHTAGIGEGADGPVTPTTPMSTGSVGKVITALAVLQLVDDGLVGLDDPVVRHLPGFELADGRAGEITIRHLLSHTSGIPNPTIVPPAEDLTDGVGMLRDMELASEPGRTHSYSNLNYYVAGRLVEVSTGTPFADHLREEVFTPLGMSDTRSVDTTPTDDPGTRHGNLTTFGTALPLREMQQFLAGAGGVVSTAEDMARLTAALNDDGRTPDGEQLLSPELLAEARSPQPGSERYGLGWQFSSPGVEPARIGHSGATSRYSTQLDTVPESGYGVVVMLNSFTPTYEHSYALSSGIIEITENGDPTPGAPVVTLVDVGFGLAALAVLALTALGVRRSGRWARRRSRWPGWRYILRLAPHAVFPVLAVVLVGVVPTLRGNAATPFDVAALWPAGTVLLFALAISGAALLSSRIWHRGAGNR